MSDNSTDNGNDADQIAKKFPGLSAKKPTKSISVERPLDSDDKTVTETGIDRIDDATATPSKEPDPAIVEKKERVSSGKKGDKARNIQNTSSTGDEPSNQSLPQVPSSESSDEFNEVVLELPPSPEQRKVSRRRKIWISTVTTVVLAVGGWALLFFSPILAIEEINHEGLDLVTESEAIERTESLGGRPLLQVGERGVRQLFEGNAAVDDVSLRAEPPHGLVVIVHEHEPIAMSPRDKHYVVFSEDGSELAEITSQKAQEFDLPVVASAADVEDEDVFNTITEVLGSLPEELRDHVRAASGSSIDSIELELNSGKTVMWGNNEQADKKAQVLEALLGLDDAESAEISEYDVSAPDFPVTR